MNVMKVHFSVPCPECKQWRAVNNDRKIRWHGRPGSWRNYPHCPGSRREVDAPVRGGLW